MNQSNVGNKWVPYFFLIPFFVIFFLFNLYPVFANLYTSFHKVPPFVALFKLENLDYVGLLNYIDVFNSNRLGAAIVQSFIYLFVINVILHSVSLLLAKMVNLTFKPLQVVVLILLLIPFLSDGLVFGFNTLSQIENPVFRQALIGMMEIINNIGFYTFVYFIVLERVSPEIKEAALLDGASTSYSFIKIEIPALKLIIKVMLLLSTVYLIQSSPLNYMYGYESGGVISAISVLFMLFIVLGTVLSVILFKSIVVVKSHIKDKNL